MSGSVHLGVSGWRYVPWRGRFHATGLVTTLVISPLWPAALFAAESAPLKIANGVLVNAAGMTVYTYDKDEPGSGKSSCVAACAKNWPPVIAQGSPRPPYSVLTRADGSKQLAHGGRPLYTFVKDKKPGDRTGMAWAASGAWSTWLQSRGNSR